MVIYYTADRTYAQGSFVQDSYVGVEGDTIVSFTRERPAPGETVVDFGTAALFPGAVNTHTHSFQTLVRGRVDDSGLDEWLRIVYAASASYGAEESYVGAAATFAEMLLTGTTTAADFFYLNGRGNQNARAVIQAGQDLGIRLVMGRTFMDAPWGGEAVQESVDTAVGRFRELRAEYGSHPSVEVSPAPHSIYGASRPMIEAAAQLADEYDTRWYMHLSDSEKSAQSIIDKHGKRSVFLLQEWGVLGNRLVGIHGMWLSEEELGVLSEHDVAIAYNPASNLFLGEKILDLPHLWQKGIRVGIATDGAASNNGLSVVRDIRLASLAQRLLKRNPQAVTVHQLINLLTEDGGRVLRQPIGRLEPGYRADFVVLNTLDFSLQPAGTLKSNIVHAISDRAISHVYVGGRQVVRDGKLVLVDQDELAKRVARVTARG